MFNAAAAFGGGFMLRSQFEGVKWPQFQRLEEEARSFKLSVRVLSASVPALSSPGLWTRQRPRLEVTLGDTQKDTELADFAADDNTSPLDNTCEFPWRFGDTLKFAMNFNDVLGGHLRLRLRAHSDFQLGPVEFQFSGIADLGEAGIDLQRRALPACVGNQAAARDGSWESPVIVIPLSHVRGGLLQKDHVLGEASAHLALSFSVDVDPEEILVALEREQRPVSEQVRSWMDQAPWSARMQSAPMKDRRIADIDTGVKPEIAHLMSNACPPDAVGALPSMRRKSDQVRRKEEHAGRGQSLQAPVSEPSRFPRTTSLISPNLASDGWISCRAPNGRTFWHHKALGPPPWESPEGSEENIPPERPNSQEDTLPEFKALPVKLLKCAQDEKPSKPIHSEAPQWFQAGHGRETWSSASTAPSLGAAPKAVQPVHAQGRAGLDVMDLEPEGWVSRQGPNGRIFWHHLALGPAPWENDGRAPSETFSI